MMKRIKILLVFVLISILPAFSNEDIKIIHGPYLQNMGEHEVTIVWIANKPSIGWLEIAPDDGSHFYARERVKIFDTKIGIKKTSTVHSIKLTGLQPGTRYRYRACTQEILTHTGHKVTYGAIAYTDVYNKKPLSFVTNNYSKKEISFAMVNDIHGRNDVLKNMIGQCDLTNTDLFFFNGDMVSFSNSEEQLFEGFMDTAVQLFAGSIPMYYCRGNHETRGSVAPDFQNYFSPKEKELYFMFRQGPVCFVVLDCGEDKPDSDIEYYGITAYDKYRTEQAEWLKKALKSELYQNAQFKVIVCHMPPFGGWHGEIDIAKKFIPLLNEASPDVYLCGHLHRYIRHNSGKEGVHFPLIVNSNNTLLKADVQNNKMEIRIYEQFGKEMDCFTIEK